MDTSKSSSLGVITGILGRQALRIPQYLLDLTTFILRALREWRHQSNLFNHATYMTVVVQMIFSGVDALPTITLLALASGLSITYQLITTVQVFGTTADVVNLLTQIVALEFGSLLTAVILIGRSGSAIAVDLANMKLNREIEGLELLGINVNHFFITPRLLGTTIAQLVLAVYFAIISVISGVVVTAMINGSSYLKYLTDIPLAFDPYDLVIFLIKNLFFGLLIGATACFHGLRVEFSTTEVPQQTQRAIVNSLSLVFILDGLFALLV
jgi:phospholipid/cholesterol/gamma-HCH transport system permease protein